MLDIITYSSETTDLYPQVGDIARLTNGTQAVIVSEDYRWEDDLVFHISYTLRTENGNTIHIKYC